MILHCETPDLSAYLREDSRIDYTHPAVQEKGTELFYGAADDMKKAEAAFLFVRDSIAHSGDIGSSRLTKCASQVLVEGEGICFTKSYLLTALLRSAGIPAGLCYQRLTLGDTPDTGYVLHGLAAVYFRNIRRWVRLDARGNKNGVDARFSVDQENIAFPVRPQYEEIDYPVIYAAAHPVIAAAFDAAEYRGDVRTFISGLDFRLPAYNYKYERF